MVGGLRPGDVSDLATVQLVDNQTQDVVYIYVNDIMMISLD